MIRALRPDEDIPATEPRRYKNASGYIRLRWKIAPGEYVEDYEHRVVMGRPGEGWHVHHIDGDKANNDPSNLVVLTATDHQLLHLEQDRRARPPRVPRFYRNRRRDAERAQRRIALDAEKTRRSEQVVALYRSGLSTIEIGERTGHDPSWILRILQQAGEPLRTKADYARPIDPDEVVRRYLDGQGARRIKADLRISDARIRRILVEAGVTIRPPGRVPGVPQRGAA